MNSASSVPDTLGSPTCSKDPGVPVRTFTVLESGTARALRPTLLCRLRSVSSSEAFAAHRRPGSALPPSGSAGLPGRALWVPWVRVLLLGQA